MCRTSIEFKRGGVAYSVWKEGWGRASSCNKNNKAANADADPAKNKELYSFNHGAIAPPASFVDHFVRDVSPIEVEPV